MRRAASCVGLSCALVLLAGSARANELDDRQLREQELDGGREESGGPGALGFAAGVSIGGIPAYGHSLNGSGPALEIEVGLAHSWSAGLEFRRHALTEVTAADDDVAVRGTSRDIGITVRHAMFVIGRRRYLDLHAGLGAERLDLRGREPEWRRYAQVGFNMLQPGSMYHLTDHLEVRFGVDVVVAKALRDPGQAPGCTGPCTVATTGPAHDVGVFGTITVGVR